MKIDNGDSINKSISRNNSSTSHSANLTNNFSAIHTDRTNSVQKTSRDWIQSNVGNISQLNEYDKGNMPVSERVVIEAIEKANKAISGGNRRFEFSIHEQTNQIMVKVFDSETDELIREIPNEKVLDMVAKICEMAGILVDERR